MHKKMGGSYRFTLLSKMIIFICLLMVIMLVFLGMYTNTKYSTTITEQTGQRALNVAQSVSQMPEIKEAFHTESPSKIIQPIAEAIRKETGAEFIVIGNKEGIRFSHPHEERVGEIMVGDDNERALQQGESYYSEATGTLGPSIRGKTPVFSTNGTIIGVVSVGFLLDDVDMTIGSYVNEIWYFILLCIVIGVIGATLISLHVKKSIFGLEPDEIGQLYQEREAILQSIHEAIIAVNCDGYVTMINQEAKKVVKLNGLDIGYHIDDFSLHIPLIEVLKTGKSQFNEEFRIGQDSFIVNSVPVYHKNRLIGAVSTFRSRTEIEQLAEELSKVQQYAEALRVQTHEFSNKLNTISGLLQLDQTNEAIDYINKESKKQQESIHFFIHRISDSYVSAVLLGKMNRAHELGIQMTIQENSELRLQLTEEQREGFITIVGNMLENAFDALQDSDNNKQVSIFFTDIGEEILFEIDDSGPGIAKVDEQQIFTKGYTTKAGTHQGIGLVLVRQTIEQLDGSLSLETSELGGACFIVSFPKK
ncbi:sensor histidine kinase [Gracilibacillus sp. S3-1-1]|uniref:Sensor histidine kinase n=1 Tax=Gracilibacillus pellucidus TaxID=3095368 RepID=A0ACC6M0E5_9BACI|nr:sensor histidine kinase [Gracilibacillus sp. S3-1-1]MDX8044386.1 sensor histidine kinase [Gracilibacillus sp. S3-1-1]